MLGIINPIARALKLFLVWTDSYYSVIEIIRPALLCQVPDHSEGVRSLYVNIYCRRRDSLSDCKFDKDVYLSVFTRSGLFLLAQHVLEHIAHILCGYPPESVVRVWAVF